MRSCFERAFSQNARITNLSTQGATLAGLEQQVRIGDLIVIQFKEKKARFRLVWTDHTRRNDGFRACIHIVPGEECPWRANLPNAICQGA